jgi:hypothetical protein
MKILIDNLSDEVVFIAPEIEYTERNTVTKESVGSVILIIGDMNAANSRIEVVDEFPDDFRGRNYLYRNGQFITKN